jgi:hypothetical protein
MNWNLKFVWRWLWRFLLVKMWLCVVWQVDTDVSEEASASIFKVVTWEGFFFLANALVLLQSIVLSLHTSAYSWLFTLVAISGVGKVWGFGSWAIWRRCECRTTSNFRMTDELGRILTTAFVARSRYYPCIYLEGLRKTTKTFRIAGVPAEIRSVERYRCDASLGIEVFTTVVIQIMLWITTQYSLVRMYRRFGGLFCHH